MQIFSDKLENILLYIFIFIISWSAIARFSDWMPLPFLFLILVFIAVFFRIIINWPYSNNIKIYQIDSIVILAILLMYISVLFNPTFKSGNYLLAYTVVFGLYVLLSALGFKEIDTNTLLKYNYHGINFICFFIILEVTGKSFLGFDIFEYLPRSKEATALVTKGFFRGYGLSTEPTQVGNYFSCFLPYAYYYRSNVKLKNMKIYSFFIFIAGLFIFSAAFIAVIFSAFFVALLITNHRLLMIKSIFIFSIVITTIFTLMIIYLGYGEIIYAILDKFNDKFTLSAGTSAGQRLGAFSAGVSSIIDKPIMGNGLGYLSSLGRDSSLNWYIFFSSEMAIPILILFIIWFGFHFINGVMNYISTKKVIFLYASLSIYGGMAYLFFLSTFQNMFLLTSILFYRIILKNINNNNG